MSHPESLFDYVAGTLAADERRELEAHLGECGACRAQLVADTRAFLAVGDMDPVSPPARLRSRLLGSARDSWVASVAEHFDLDAATARQVLLDSEDKSRWELHETGAKLFHLNGGPKWAAADCGLVWIPRGFDFPRHEHAGDERALVLQGTIVDSSGRVYRRGDVSVMLAGSRHSYKVGDETDALFALVLFGGINVL